MGWKLSGPLAQHGNEKTTTEGQVAEEVDTLAEQVKTLCDIESYASNFCIPGKSKEDGRAIKLLEAIIKFDVKRYENGHSGTIQSRACQIISVQQ